LLARIANEEMEGTLMKRSWPNWK